MQSTELNENSAINDIADAIRTEGYRAKVVQRGEEWVIESGTSGYNILVASPSPGTIQLLCGVARDNSPPVPLEYLNDFNSRYRFAKLYLDEDGDITANGDFFFDPKSETAKAHVRLIYQLFDATIVEINEILRRTQEAVTQPSE